MAEGTNQASHTKLASCCTKTTHIGLTVIKFPLAIEFWASDGLNDRPSWVLFPHKISSRS